MIRTGEAGLADGAAVPGITVGAVGGAEAGAGLVDGGHC